MKQSQSNMYSILGILSFIIAKLLLDKIGIQNIPIQITTLVLFISNIVVIMGIRKRNFDDKIKKYYTRITILFPILSLMATIILVFVIIYPYLVDKYITFLWICLATGVGAFIAFTTTCVKIIKNNK